MTTIGSTGTGNKAMTFGIEPSSTYELSCHLLVTPAANTAVPAMQATGPAGTPTLIVQSINPIGGGTGGTTTGTAYSTPVTATATGTTNNVAIDYIANLSTGAITTPPGTVSVQIEATASTVLPLGNSECKLTPQSQMP
jgi:hypothetical protein